MSAPTLDRPMFAKTEAVQKYNERLEQSSTEDYLDPNLNRFENDLQNLPDFSSAQDDINVDKGLKKDSARAKLYQEGRRIADATSTPAQGVEDPISTKLNTANTAHLLHGTKSIDKDQSHQGLLITGNATVTTNKEKGFTEVHFEGEANARMYKGFIPNYIAVNGTSTVAVNADIPVIAADDEAQTIKLVGDKRALIAMGTGKTTVEFAGGGKLGVADSATIDGRFSNGINVKGESINGVIIGSRDKADKVEIEGPTSIANYVSLGGGTNSVAFASGAEARANWRSIDVPSGATNIQITPTDLFPDRELESLASDPSRYNQFFGDNAKIEGYLKDGLEGLGDEQLTEALRLLQGLWSPNEATKRRIQEIVPTSRINIDALRSVKPGPGTDTDAIRAFDRLPDGWKEHALKSWFPGQGDRAIGEHVKDYRAANRLWSSLNDAQREIVRKGFAAGPPPPNPKVHYADNIAKPLLQLAKADPDARNENVLFGALMALKTAQGIDGDKRPSAKDILPADLSKEAQNRLVTYLDGLIESPDHAISKPELEAFKKMVQP